MRNYKKKIIGFHMLNDINVQNMISTTNFINFCRNNFFINSSLLGQRKVTPVDRVRDFILIIKFKHI